MREVTVVGVREWPARAVNKNSTQLNSTTTTTTTNTIVHVPLRRGAPRAHPRSGRPPRAAAAAGRLRARAGPLVRRVRRGRPHGPHAAGLLRHTADAAAARFWREAGSPSALAARALYISIYRRRWGCEAALQGARLRLARSYLVGSAAAAGGAASGGSADAFGAGFAPSREADVAAAGAPTLGGMPAGQRG